MESLWFTLMPQWCATIVSGMVLIPIKNTVKQLKHLHIVCKETLFAYANWQAFTNDSFYLGDPKIL